SCNFDITAFADDRYFYLPRVGQLFLNFLRDVPGNLGGLGIRDVLMLYDNPDFTPRLNGVSLFYAPEAVGQLLQFLESLDVGVKPLPPCPRSGRRKRLGRRNEDRFHAGRLDIAVMRTDGVDHFRRFPVFSRQLGPDRRMPSLFFMADRLAD